MDSSPLPIDAALPELTGALRANNVAVLVAPPGAGKTTRVPLVLAAAKFSCPSIDSTRVSNCSCVSLAAAHASLSALIQ